MAIKQSTRTTSSPKSPSPKTGISKSRRNASRRSSTSSTSPRSAPGVRGTSSAKAATSRTPSTGTRGAKAASGSGSGGSTARSRKPTAPRRGPGVAPDALTLLEQDHDAVDQMFKKYQRMKEGDERKSALRQQILGELTVHAQVEEELFYPALRSLFEAAGKDKAVALIDEADVEHQTLKWLIQQLEGGDQGDEGMTDARVKVLSEYVKHHVEEEEGEIFKAAKKVDLDLADLGRQLDARKRQLKGEESAEGEVGGDKSMQVAEPLQMASGRKKP